MRWLDAIKLGRAECEAFCREKAMAYTDGDEVVCRVLGEYKVRGSSRNRDIMPCLVFDGFWEMWVTRMLSGFVKPCYTVVDVGANVGYFTLAMAELVGPGGSVIAYEPVPDTCERLIENVRLNGFAGRVHCYDYAIGDRERNDFVWWCDKIDGGSTVGRELPESFDQKRHPVSVYRLDQRVMHRVDLLKIDAEGMDAEVVRGAETLFRRNPAMVAVMEFDPSHRDKIADMMEWAITTLSMAFWMIDGDGSVRRTVASEILDGPFCNIVLARA